jgi:hypothetical protein
LDPARQTIILPGLLRAYWADFGNSKSKVLKMILDTTGSKFREKLKPYLPTVAEANNGNSKPRVDFSSIDWTPVLLI